MDVKLLKNFNSFQGLMLIHCAVKFFSAVVLISRYSDFSYHFQGLMPIHCAAMQGRADVVQLLMDEDKDGLIKKSLAEESKTPPSVVNLSVANDFTECAQW